MLSEEARELPQRRVPPVVLFGILLAACAGVPQEAIRVQSDAWLEAGAAGHALYDEIGAPIRSLPQSNPAESAAEAPDAFGLPATFDPDRVRRNASAGMDTAGMDTAEPAEIRIRRHALEPDRKSTRLNSRH